MNNPTRNWVSAQKITGPNGEPYADIEVCATQYTEKEPCEEGSWWTLDERAVSRRSGHQHLLCTPFATARVWCRNEEAASFAGRLGIGTQTRSGHECKLIGITAHHGITIPMIAGVPTPNPKKRSLWTGDEGRFWEQMGGWPGTGRRGGLWPDPRASEVDARLDEERTSHATIDLGPTPDLPRAIPSSAPEFTEQSVGKEQLSRWLARFARVRSSAQAPAPDGTYTAIKRGMPQGGALRTTEIWIALRAVQEMNPGLYRYDEVNHRLEHRSDTIGSLIEKAKVSLGTGVGTPAGVTVVCARMKPLLAKYTGIAFSIAMTNAGVCLAAAQAAAAHEEMVVRGLGAVPASAWLEVSAEDPQQVCPVAAFAFGRNPSQVQDSNIEGIPRIT